MELADPRKTPEDNLLDEALRPLSFAGFIGQEELIMPLKQAILKAKERGELLDHILLTGAPGLGKTTLAFLISEGSLVALQGYIEKTNLWDAIWSLEEEGKRFLFIDEIHSLPRKTAESLYAALEKRIGKIFYEAIPSFTLIGATTEAGKLPKPFLDRFGICISLRYYSIEELKTIIKASAAKLQVQIDEEAATLLAKMSRGTPRIANRLLKRVRDLVEGYIDREKAWEACSRWGFDSEGLTQRERDYLLALLHFGGKAGLRTIAGFLSEEPQTVQQMYEPFLLRKAFISIESSGRLLRKAGYEYIQSLHKRRRNEC